MGLVDFLQIFWECTSWKSVRLVGCKFSVFSAKLFGEKGKEWRSKTWQALEGLKNGPAAQGWQSFGGTGHFGMAFFWQVVIICGDEGLFPPTKNRTNHLMTALIWLVDPDGTFFGVKELLRNNTACQLISHGCASIRNWILATPRKFQINSLPTSAFFFSPKSFQSLIAFAKFRNTRYQERWHVVFICFDFLDLKSCGFFKTF